MPRQVGLARGKWLLNSHAGPRIDRYSKTLWRVLQAEVLAAAVDGVGVRTGRVRDIGEGALK